MRALIRALVFFLVALAAFAGSAAAQFDPSSLADSLLTELRVDEIVADPEMDRVIVRGSREQPDGSRSALEYECDGKARTLAVRDLTASTQDIYLPPPGTCPALAKALRQREPANSAR